MKQYELKYFPCNDDKKQMVCVMTGSDGGITWASKIAKKFKVNNISACAFAYWNYKSLPKELSCIAIESIEDMVIKLKRQGYEKIYLYGFPKGAEMALIAASFLSDIDGVIAVSPSCVVFEGFSLKGYSGHSAWTYKGYELPFVSMDIEKFNLAKMYLSEGGYAFLNNFKKSFDDKFSDEYRIKIEKANCNILLISSKDDSIWPSYMMSERIIKKLEEVAYPYSYKHLSYEKASHVLCPINSLIFKVFPQERKYSKDCAKARKNAFEYVINWIAVQNKIGNPLIG